MLKKCLAQFLPKVTQKFIQSIRPRVRCRYRQLSTSLRKDDTNAKASFEDTLHVNHLARRHTDATYGEVGINQTVLRHDPANATASLGPMVAACRGVRSIPKRPRDELRNCSSSNRLKWALKPIWREHSRHAGARAMIELRHLGPSSCG